MATNTKIEWADASINPLVGCSKISPACDNCYAERMAARMVHNPAVAQRYAGTVDAHGKWTGQINVLPNELLEKARRMRRPRRIFVGSMSDMFHPHVPDGHIARIFTQMAMVGHHTYMLLTKRPDRMRELLSRHDMQDAVRCTLQRWRDEADLPPQDFWWPLPNVWLGTTVEDQAHMHRVVDLMGTPAALHYLSYEPALGAIDPTRIPVGMVDDGDVLNALTGTEYLGDAAYTVPRLDWIIAGGETGPGARAAHPDWFRSLRDQCKAHDVPYFFKSWGEWLPAPERQFNSFQYPHQGYLSPDLPYDELPGPSGANGEGVWGPEKLIAAGCAHVVRVGKARSGRLLDGVEHNAIPVVRG